MRSLYLGIVALVCCWLPVRAQDLEQLRGEVQALRREIESLREEMRKSCGEKAAPPETGASVDFAEEQRLIAAKVNEQHQTKIDSGSKYKVRLSGMALLSGSYIRGGVDDIDLARIASTSAPGEPPGSVAATLRQSTVRLEVFGPRWGGARASGDLQFDFFGGFPASPEGVTAGLLRLRTANLRLDWQNTALVAGQDTPFFSPLSPTSLIASAYPALSSAGNLWTWTPQVYVERQLRHSGAWAASVQGGVLDGLTGELPVTEYSRTATAGERSRMPAYAVRFSLRRPAGDRSAQWGLGGYYSRQNWSFNRVVDGWLVTSDWELPLGTRVSLSGEMYRGRAIGGLGGGATGSVAFTGAFDDSASRALPFDSTGGWAQFKLQPANRFEFNAAFGKDVSSIADIAAAFGKVHRNAAAFGNVIYQPRSNLMFSVEYRRLWTSRYWLPLRIADQIGWGAGILF